MLLKEKKISFNYRSDPPRPYDSTLYWCAKDDVWIQIEEPQKVLA